MGAEAMKAMMARVFGANPDLTFEFYCMASEIVDDFEDDGPLLQCDENAEYGERTPIRRLQAVRNRFIRLFEQDAGL
jgi:hypothetical protein